MAHALVPLHADAIAVPVADSSFLMVHASTSIIISIAGANATKERYMRFIRSRPNDLGALLLDVPPERRVLAGFPPPKD